MSWLKFDDQFPDHPKVVQAGPLAGWVHVCGICYCGRYLTDGFVPHDVVERLASFKHIGISTGGVAGMFEVGHDVEIPELVARLVEVGLWHTCDGGYLVHDYLEYNPSRAEVLAKRSEAKQRMRDLRALRSPDVPANKLGTADEVRPLPSPSPSPIPIPIPIPIPSRTPAAVGGEASANPQPATTAASNPGEKEGITQLLEDTLKRGLSVSDMTHWTLLVHDYGREIATYAVNEAFVCDKHTWAYIDTVAEAEHGRTLEQIGKARGPP